MNLTALKQTPVAELVAMAQESRLEKLRWRSARRVSGIFNAGGPLGQDASIVNMINYGWLCLSSLAY